MKSPPPTSASASSSAPPPSYSESLASSTHGRLPLTPPTYATSLRAPHISDIVNDPIMEHVRESRFDGVNSMTLILVPSNVSNLIHVDLSDRNPKQAPDYAFPNEEVIGFPSNDNIKIIRLNEFKNRLEFWRQASVIREISMQLQRALEVEGYHVVDHIEDQRLPSRSSAASPSHDVRSVEWKMVEQHTLAPGEARAKADFKEVTLRIQNEMGLYETRSGMAVVVKTEFGVVDEADF